MILICHNNFEVAHALLSEADKMDMTGPDWVSEINSDWNQEIDVKSFRHFFSRQKIELIFMGLGGSGASPGNLSQPYEHIIGKLFPKKIKV